MQIDAKQRTYWSKNLRLTVVLLIVWFFATFVMAYFARELNNINILGFPLGFYMSAQGSLVIYVLVIWYYAHYMNRLDMEYGIEEGRGE